MKSDSKKGTKKKVPISARRQPMTPQSRETVSRIRQAAAWIVENEGLPRLSSNRIAHIAGVSIGTVYKFFPNKQAIMASVVTEWSAERGKSLDAIENLDPSASLSQRIELWFHHLTYTPAIHVVSMSRALRFYPELRDIDEAYQKRVAGIIETALRRDGCQLDKRALNRVARQISALGSHLLSQIHASVESDREELMQWSLRIMRAAISDATNEEYSND